MTLQGGAWSLCWLALCRHRSLNLAAGQGRTGSLGCAASLPWRPQQRPWVTAVKILQGGVANGPACWLPSERVLPFLLLALGLGR